MGFENNSNNFISYKREFLNREDISDKIKTLVEDLNDKNTYKVFLIYGIGGIGKTELLKKIKNTYSDINKIVFISFSDTKDPIKKILDIRNCFTTAPHFDYLFLKYWELTKSERLNENYINTLNRQFLYLEKKYSLAANIISGISYEIAYASDFLRIGKNIWDFWKNKRMSEEFNEILENIDMYPEKILRKLHLYLAEDILENYAESKPIFIFDNYKPEMLDIDVEWLREFVNAFNEGLFIIASREKLSWNKSNSKFIEETKLSVIPREYAENYLHKLAIDPTTIALIIKKTDCIPFYLDIAIQLYFNSNEQKFDLLIKNHSSLVKAFLSHLSSDELKIAEILSIIDLYNLQIYNYILELNYLDNTMFLYNEFCNKSIMVDCVNLPNSKINSILAQNIEALTTLEKKKIYSIQYLEIIVNRCIYELLPHEVMPYIANAFILMHKYFLNGFVNKKIMDYLFDMVLYLLDTAWIVSLYEQLKTLEMKGMLLQIYLFIKGSVERQFDIDLGFQTLRSINQNELGNTKHIKTIICEINYLQSISGNYCEAEKNFKMFYHSLQPVDRNERFYLKGSIYYADMLMLRGYFKNALMVFEELKESPYFITNKEISKSIYAELLKQSGHCYRFNMQLESALKCYRSNFLYETEPLRIKAYRLTTECETLCYFHPHEVREIANDALDINARIQNNNSRAKIYYSLAITEIHNRSFKKAHKYIEKSMKINRQTQYPAGNLFTLVALGYIEYAEHGFITNRVINEFFRLYDMLDKIYGFLLLPIYIMKSDFQKVEELRNKFEWIDFDDTQNKYEIFLSMIKCQKG